MVVPKSTNTTLEDLIGLTLHQVFRTFRTIQISCNPTPSGYFHLVLFRHHLQLHEKTFLTLFFSLSAASHSLLMGSKNPLNSVKKSLQFFPNFNLKPVLTDSFFTWSLSREVFVTLSHPLKPLLSLMRLIVTTWLGFWGLFDTYLICIKIYGRLAPC